MTCCIYQESIRTVHRQEQTGLRAEMKGNRECRTLGAPGFRHADCVWTSHSKKED